MKVCSALWLLIAVCLALEARSSPSNAGADAFTAYQRQSEQTIRFLESRLHRDPDDVIAINRLSLAYLQKARETGSLDYLQLAAKRAAQSLKSVGERQNEEGLAIWGRVQYESHEFAAARDVGQKLVRLAPGKVGSYALLGDSLLELGFEDRAAEAYAAMRELDADAPNVLARTGRLALLRGDVKSAESMLEAALQRGVSSADSQPEQLAWCHWQLGEICFSVGRYEEAEQHDRAALAAFPNYFRALGALGRARWARGDLPDAIRQYEHAVNVVPDPTFVGTLGDLYHLAGREKEARQQYDLVEKIARLSAFAGVLYNRPLALFRADHDIKVQDAYADTAREFEVRKDIYGADAVAWTALKAGKLDEASVAIGPALRLGTQDARLFYHAGMIALARHDSAGAARWLGKALELNPKFDPLQSTACEKALSAARQGSLK